MVEVSKNWIKKYVTELKGMKFEDLNNYKKWNSGFPSTLSGEHKKAIEQKKWNGEFQITFSAIEKPIRAVVR